MFHRPWLVQLRKAVRNSTVSVLYMKGVPTKRSTGQGKVGKVRAFIWCLTSFHWLLLITMVILLGNTELSVICFLFKYQVSQSKANFSLPHCCIKWPQNLQVKTLLQTYTGITWNHMSNVLKAWILFFSTGYKKFPNHGYSIVHWTWMQAGPVCDQKGMR